MSGQVTSETSVFPPFHGTMEAPSGRLPSDRERPRGSHWLGILAASRDLLIMLLIANVINCFNFFSCMEQIYI